MCCMRGRRRCFVSSARRIARGGAGAAGLSAFALSAAALWANVTMYVGDERFALCEGAPWANVTVIVIDELGLTLCRSLARMTADWLEARPAREGYR